MKEKNNEIQNKKVNNSMKLVSLKKFERHVCLVDCVRISFLLLLGILWNFLVGAGSNYPQYFVR